MDTVVHDGYKYPSYSELFYLYWSKILDFKYISLIQDKPSLPYSTHCPAGDLTICHVTVAALVVKGTMMGHLM